MKSKNRLFKADYWNEAFKHEIERKSGRKLRLEKSHQITCTLDVGLGNDSWLECKIYEGPDHLLPSAIHLIEAKFFSKHRQDEYKTCTFDIHDWKKFSVTELLNLFSGRYIRQSVIDKEEETINNWYVLRPIDPATPNVLKLVFKNFRSCYLENLLPVYPIRGIDKEPFRKALAHALEKGNRELVTFIHATRVERKFIWFNPYTSNIIFSPAHLDEENQYSKS